MKCGMCNEDGLSLHKVEMIFIVESKNASDMNGVDKFKVAIRRESAPDLMKGIAVILMIQVHLMELFATVDIQQSALGKISLFLGGPPAAPVFMAIMGYFVARSQQSSWQKMALGVKLLVWGLLLNLGLNAHLLIRIISGDFDLNPWTYVFGVDILFLAGFSVIILTLAKRLFKNKWYLWFLLMLIFGFLNIFLPVYAGDIAWLKYVQAFFWGFYHWAYFSLFPWAAYPVAGYLFYLIANRFSLTTIHPRWRLLLAGLMLALLLIFFNYGFNVASNLSVYYHHQGWFMMWTLLFLLLMLMAVSSLPEKLMSSHPFRYLQWVGKNVTAFYVFQWLIIGNIATALFQSQQWTGLMFWFGIVVLSSSLLVFTWQKFRPLFGEK